jgi:PPOX class probable F420-dependent enzyme
MLTNQIRQFASETHRGVLTTFRRNGSAQMSIISCGPYRDGIAFTTTADRAKLANLKRNPRCSLLVSQEDWWGYVVLEGHAEILSPENTAQEELQMALRDVYRAASGTEHPNWEEYDEAMQEQRRSVVIVVPERVYGTRA